MELNRGLHDVYFAVIGARATSQGETKAQSFALGTNKAIAKQRAKRIYDLWLNQPGGLWTLDAFRQAKKIGQGAA